MSRTLFYRLRQRFELYGPDGVHPKRRQARCGRPATVTVQTERRVIAIALATSAARIKNAGGADPALEEGKGENCNCRWHSSFVSSSQLPATLDY